MAAMQTGNSQFRTSDLFSVLLLGGIVSSIFGAMLAHGLKDTRPSQALSMARSLAHQINGQNEIWLKEVQQSVGVRAPASVNGDHSSSTQLSAHLGIPLQSGELGRDPWGRPYRYFVRPTSSGSGFEVFVWSLGADGKNQSQPESIPTEVSSFQFSGDDVGHVLPTVANL